MIGREKDEPRVELRKNAATIHQVIVAKCGKSQRTFQQVGRAVKGRTEGEEGRTEIQGGKKYKKETS